MIWKTRARAALVFGLAVGLVGCGGDHANAYKKAFSAAERAQTAGRYDDAATHYLAAASGTQNAHDRVQAQYLSAIMHARAGDFATASAMLEPIANATPETDYSALSAYKLADMRIAHGEEARGWDELQHVPIRFPDHGVGRVALFRFEKHVRETAGIEAALAYVTHVKEKAGMRDAAEAASYERGKLLAELGKKAEARDALIATADTWPYPKGAFFDDSLYAASELDEELGDVPRAIADLERMHEVREVAYLYGSYQRPKFSAGLYREGVLYAEKLHDRKKARETMHALYTEYTSSTLRDAALFYEAKLWADDRDHEHECATLRTLTEKLVDSKYVPCAEEKCPSVKRDSKSKAPKTCHLADDISSDKNQVGSISGGSQ